MELRNYQIEIASDACDRLVRLGIVYLAMEVRTGKTLTALETAKLFGAKRVLFTTKKKAISSIEGDYKALGYEYELVVVNNESIHKVEGDFDLLISDEHHRVGGAFPKPNKVAKYMKERFVGVPMIFLSGTPTPEGYSQIYHQFWVSSFSPFNKWSNFYKWAKDFVDVYQIDFGYGKTNRYERARKYLIDPIVSPYFIYYSQKQSGFESEVNETVLYCPMSKMVDDMIVKLKRDRVLQGKEEVVLADTPVKLMSKVHQLCSGTIKFESGKAMTVDKSKAYFIANKFAGVKIAIFYKFKQELECLKSVFGEKLTDDLDTFNNSEDMNIALQIVSGREGISLAAATYLVYYNIDFSALSYWQSRDRLTTMQRASNDVFWVFSEGGIEEKVYKTVLDKKDYTLNKFERDYV
jgi:hypothetical protein